MNYSDLLKSLDAVRRNTSFFILVSAIMNPTQWTDPSGLTVKFAGDLETQRALQLAYGQVGATTRGALLESTLENSRIVYIIENARDNDAFYNFDTNVISIDPNYHPMEEVDTGTSCALQPAPTNVAMGHEIGHAATGTLDNGTLGMNDVNQNENPIRGGLGEPPRLSYSAEPPELP